ncbi:GGDEF domain-containing protein [Sulfurospirillum oryzae]|uniref:GGDEF domain-containing protein n=1 Tax=Sulfurospirillum oryzae TaxID=2976535 RepID=UPI0021E76548|nr:GGDEF domain-containing protein [Sulfurospirillum oryzae]
MQKKLSLVIVGTIFISFMILMVISALSIRNIGIKNAEEKAQIISNLVQDGLSAHMLSGTMDQREFFLKKISTAKGVDALWIVRSESVVNQFGKGLNNEVMRDGIDEQALKSGQVQQQSEENAHSAKLRVTTPYIAKEHGIPNCMQCHNAKEGDVLGAISIVFDIGEVRTNGILTSLTILGISIIIMLLVFVIINRSMQPLMELFHSIKFVMKKAQEGEYVRRVRCSSNDKEYQDVKFWLNSLLDKLEDTLKDIEVTVKKFLALSPNHQPDLLLETQSIVHELSDIYQFKRTIEFDEDKEQVYKRIGSILQNDVGLQDFILIESGKNDIHPSIVFDASSKKRTINLNCRALRTKQTVNSEQFRDICGLCATSAFHLCIPYLITSDFELLLTIWAKSQEELAQIKEKLPKIQNYIDAARPELVSKNLTEILKVSSTTDALTELYNRKYLDEYIEKALSQAKRNGIAYGILMIDIDWFKMVNDTYGHDVGDKAIKVLAQVLKENIRESDTAFRFGGEEFLVLLYECEEAMVLAIAEKIRLAFEKSPIQAHNGASFYKTLSVGASIFPNDSDSLWKCVKFADIALYNAKDSGRNCSKRFQASMVDATELKTDF